MDDVPLNRYNYARTHTNVGRQTPTQKHTQDDTHGQRHSAYGNDATHNDYAIKQTNTHTGEHNFACAARAEKVSAKINMLVK